MEQCHRCGLRGNERAAGLRNIFVVKISQRLYNRPMAKTKITGGSRKYLLAISLLVVVATAFTKPVRAERLYSVASLTLVCGSDNLRDEGLCITYLHGVVETWMLNDLVSVEPFRYRSGSLYCDTISKVSEKE
jgi:hypothetical protein